MYCRATVKVPVVRLRKEDWYARLEAKPDHDVILLEAQATPDLRQKLGSS
jgi:hypothetical protein